MTELNFVSERSDVEDLLGLEPFTGVTTVDLFQGEVGSPFGFNFNTPTASAEGDITADVSLNLNLGEVDLGNLLIEYTVDLLIGIPDLVRAGDPFIIDVDDGVTRAIGFGVFDAAINTRGLGFDDLSLDLSVAVSDASLTNVSVFSEELGQRLDVGDFSSDDVAADIRLIDLRDGETEIAQDKGFAAIVGQPDETPLRTAPDLPQIQAQFADIQQSRRDSLLDAEIDVSELLFNLDFLQNNPAVADLEALSNRLLQNSIVESTGVTVDFLLDLVSVFICAGFDVVQIIRFEPTEIQVEVSVEDQGQSTLISDAGFVETSLEFVAPEIDELLIADGEVDGFISHDLQGDLIVSIAIEPKGTISTDALAGLVEVIVDDAEAGDKVAVGRT